MKEKGLRIILGLGLILIISGCQFQPQQLLPPADSKIAIPVFVNHTYQPGLEDVLSQEVIEQFHLRTRFVIVSLDRADLILRGVITQYLKEPLAEVAEGVKEYRVRMVVQANLSAPQERQVYWKEIIEEAAVYSALEEKGIQTEDEAIERICEKISQDLVNLALEGWQR